MKRFYTGTFTSEDGTCSTAQRAHSDYEHDDVVIDDSGNFLVHDRSKVSGYVSGIGNTVVIHIKEPFNNPENNDYIKEIFGLKEDSGLSPISDTPCDTIQSPGKATETEKGGSR